MLLIMAYKAMQTLPTVDKTLIKFNALSEYNCYLIKFKGKNG